jgi:hypothetical protein
MTPLRLNNRPVWIGQISRDVGVRLTLKVWPPVTHKIDPAVDEAREYLVEDLMVANVLAKLGFVSGSRPSSPEDPKENLTGDPYFTDGLRAVLVVAKEPVPLDKIDLLMWEWPPQYKEFKKWIDNQSTK